MKDIKTIEAEYQYAKDQYASLSVNTNEAINKLDKMTWQVLKHLMQSLEAGAFR